MIEWARNIANKPATWLIGASLLVVMPLFLFGSPGFYGDDLNALLAIENDGTLGAISNWMREYGVVYRPVGIILMYNFYDLFKGSEFFIYLVYVSLYVVFSFVLYRQILRLTDESGLSVFTAVFFLLFPFNPTAFWQLSSISMIVTGLLSVVMIRKVIEISMSPSTVALTMWCVGWSSLLLMYEQIVGFAALIAVLIFFSHAKSGAKYAFYRSMHVSVYVFSITIIFIVAYVLLPGNPKIATLQKSSSVMMASQEKVESHTNIQQLSPGDRISQGRVKAIKNRFISGFVYIYESVFYGVRKLSQVGVNGVVMMSIVAVFACLTLFVKLSFLSRSVAKVFFVIGLLWVFVTLSPFILYKEVHVPPYSLMIPSIGFAILIYAVVSFFLHGNENWVVKYVLKTLLISFAFLLPLVQYSYYFGLREELIFWDNIAGNVEAYKKYLDDGSVLVVHNVPDKDNGHVFWIEKAVGYRYFATLLGPNYSGVNIDKNNSVIKLNLPDKKSKIVNYIHLY